MQALTLQITVNPDMLIREHWIGASFLPIVALPNGIVALGRALDNPLQVGLTLKNSVIVSVLIVVGETRMARCTDPVLCLRQSRITAGKSPNPTLGHVVNPAHT